MSSVMPKFGPGAELDDFRATRRSGPRRIAWGAAALAALALLLVIVNILLGLLNQSLRAGVQHRAAFLTQTAALGRIDDQLIVAIASKAAASHDPALDALLKRAGVTYRINPKATTVARKAVAPKAGTP